MLHNLCSMIVGDNASFPSWKLTEAAGDLLASFSDLLATSSHIIAAVWMFRFFSSIVLTVDLTVTPTGLGLV
jgi:hypothetical protein